MAAKAWEGLITREEAAGMDPGLWPRPSGTATARVSTAWLHSARSHDPANGYFGHPDFTYGR